LILRIVHADWHTLIVAWLKIGKINALINEMLLASAWARELSAEQFQQINEGIVVRTIPTGGFVCMKGEPVEYWMGVVVGLVKMASIWSTGRSPRSPACRLAGGSAKARCSRTKREDTM
jgi:hypothetical protein